MHIRRITNSETSENVHACNSLDNGLRWLSEHGETGRYAIMPRTDRRASLAAIHFIDVTVYPDTDPIERGVCVDGKWNY